MKVIKKEINNSIIGKDAYDLIFETIDKVIIEHGTISVNGKDKHLKQAATTFMVGLLLIEELNKMYSICEDEEDKDVFKQGIFMLYKRVNAVNGGGKNGNKRNKGRSSKKYSKNR